MLESVKEERSRLFKLALRIGLPIIVLILLLVYEIFYRESLPKLTTETIVLFAALVFVSIYFVFFVVEESRKSSLLDPVTDSYRYPFFLQHLKDKRPQTLAILVVSNLFTVNENYGDEATDRMLKQLVTRLNAQLIEGRGRHGFIGRHYGTEFLLALDDSPESVRETIERFIEENPVVEGIELEYGFAVLKNNLEDPENAIAQLRHLLRHPVYSDIPEEEKKVEAVPDAQKLSRAERDILDALEQEKMELYFRPLKNLKNDRVDIYEIAVKLKDREGKAILPRNFLPVINRNNLGEEYDTMIYRRVISLLKLIDPKVSLSFNLSPFSLRRKSFHERLLKDLEESRLDPGRMIIELYERKTHHRMDHYFELLNALKRHGIRFCLDNFGSSNASMEYIKHFRFDMIQFDRDYIVHLDDEKKLSILKSLVALAHDLNILTVAKWVDDENKVQKLRKIGLDYIQGFYVGRILNEEELVHKFNPLPSGAGR